MKSNPFLLSILLLLGLSVVPLVAQDSQKAAFEVDVAVPAIRYEVKNRQAIALPGEGGRKLILERVKPPVLPPDPPAAKPIPVDPAVRAARRAAWAANVPREQRLLSLTGIYYPNGLTLLKWFAQGADGKWETYEAWSRTDFRSIWLVHDFEVNRTRYSIFPVISPAGKWDLRRNFPGPVDFPEGTPGYRITKGDASNAKAREAIDALHEIYSKEGAALHAQWETQLSAEVTEAARMKADPPPVEDIVIRVWPLKSNLFPEAEAEAAAAGYHVVEESSPEAINPQPR
jgi:hypothetical protein